MLPGLLTFATSLHAQSTTTAKAEKPSCYQPCSKATQANAYQNYIPVVLVASPAEEKASTPNATMTAKEKANCQRVCAKTIAVNGKCDPKDCPPECLPPNCKIVSCKSKSTVMAVNQKPSDQK